MTLFTLLIIYYSLTSYYRQDSFPVFEMGYFLHYETNIKRLDEVDNSRLFALILKLPCL